MSLSKAGYETLFAKKYMRRFCDLKELEFSNLCLSNKHMEALQPIPTQSSLRLLHRCFETICITLAFPSEGSLFLNTHKVSTGNECAVKSG